MSLHVQVLLFFLFELIVNFHKLGCSGFFSSEDYVWNCLDLFIVVMGAMDQWVIRLLFVVMYGRHHSDELGNSLMLFRLLRMLRPLQAAWFRRILRVLRLVKAIHPLYMLALGIAEATATKVEVPDSARQLFRTVPDSMFTLFVLMNGEEWPDVMPLLDAFPSLKFMFVIFIIISTWALLSVVSDNMIYAREAQTRKDETLQGERRAKVQKALNDVFVASHGGSRDDKRLNDQDWQELLKVPFYAKKISDVVPTVPKKDLADMFAWLQAEADGKVPFEEVLRGVHTLAEPPSGKSILQVDSEVKQRFSRLANQADYIEDCIMDMDEKVKESYASMHAMLDELIGISGVVMTTSSMTPDSFVGAKASPEEESAAMTPRDDVMIPALPPVMPGTGTNQAATQRDSGSYV
ncbi:unnamed protein product [Cladocopium goreaui]|uniref:Protein YIPF5 n=1 Tax=Cladocopium goreaui TaxID=2562237 RepID=A0A9P1M2S9_9DINO|nr:unnamed protein product [Cladocopium goreaui]